MTHSGPRILILKYWQKRPSGPFAAGNFDYHHHAAIQTTQPGSMPLAFSTDAAAGAVSNFINALAACGSLELEAMPAAKMVYSCNSVGNGPRSSTPRTDTSSLAWTIPSSASPVATAWGVSPGATNLVFALASSAMPRR